MIKQLSLIFLLTTLYACGGSDNSEPPAELVDFEASVEIEELWNISVGDGDKRQYLKLYPLMLEERLIVADRNGDVIAVDLEQGKTVWEVDLKVVLSGGVGGNEQHHLVTTRDGEIISLDASGKIVWREQISSEVLVPPVIVNNVVVIRSIDGQITGLDVNTGKQNWIYNREVPDLTLRGNSRPVVNQNYVYTGLDNGRMTALDSNDGNVLYDVVVAIPEGRSELERMVDIDGDAQLNDNVLYMASFQGRVVAIDVRKGQQLWSRKLSSSTGVDVDASSLFISDSQDHVWAMDKNNGATLWKQEKLQARKLTRPVVMDDMLVVGDYEGYLHWLSKYDGHFMARVDTDNEGFLVPPVLKDDRLYVISRDGNLSVFRIKNN